uniref:Protein TASOR-like n=1 Tax=Sinocyclocheilus grahami TaxID=75366 RepID=A0A672MRK3_SINGR
SEKMACNFSQERKIDKESSKAGGLTLEDGDSKKQLLSASSTATSKQNGDQAGCEDEQMSEQDASERRRAGLSDLKNRGGSPSTLPRSAEELPRRNFQIPRKIKERRGLLQQLSPDSREFEEVVKLLSTFYLDTTSRGTFTYTKASLIHNELLEKEFIEKKRELKQNGRTEAELAESYAFLLPDKNKVRLCHPKIAIIYSPSCWVYLSKYSDLLQMNPFEVGAAGDIIIFKIMKGKVKTIFENMPKNNLEPTLKHDSHALKNASKVTSLLSYRAFEHTQQYFYEFAFEELRSRPRHVFPYAVVSFQYKGKESATKVNYHLLWFYFNLERFVFSFSRLNSTYTVWSGSLVNKGEEVYQVYMRSSSLPHLPFKLPDKLDINVAMHLDQVKRKIPPILLSWEAYSGSREAFKCGMYCSLYEVMGRSKQENSLSGLLHRLERERMVLVKPLIDKGFLFLLSSSQLHTTTGRFIFFVFRCVCVTDSSCFLVSKNSGVDEDPLAPLEPKDPNSYQIDNFVPALHHGFYKLRANPPKELAVGLKRQVLDYLNQKEQGVIRPFHIVEYRHSLDDRTNQHPAPRPKNMDVALNSYIFGPGQFQLPVEALQQDLMDSQQGAASPPAGAEEYSPVSDWGGSDRQVPGSSTIGVSQSNGGAQRPRGEYEKEKMEKLLKLIQLHKRTLGKDEGSGPEREEDWDPAGLKRRLEREGPGGVSKYLRMGLLNGEPGRGKSKQVHSTRKVVDTVLDSEFQNLCTGIQKLMGAQHIIYNSQPPLPRCEDQDKWSSSAFSPFVSKYVSSLPVQGYVNTLCEKMSCLVQAPRASVQPVAVVSPPAVASVPAPLPPVHLFSAEKSANPKSADVVENPICSPSSGSASQPPIASVPEIPSDPSQAGTSSTVGGSVIGQIKPDVLCTLVEIMQKNAVKFYIQRGDEESELCIEIKEYLRSLGNIDCNPQNYLESKSQQKFMIIIQNEDIAAHVHKIPALVSLKKLPTVYFAGVDSLDDVKNRTYNELFVSGGLIVSDELILNPDNITLEKLRAFLKFLEEQGSPWKWKVHCKTQKKLKELSRLNTEALDVLNLLTTYQKKHLVEFLPYHECDTPSRQAPDLDCLVKLQAQHTQLRHFIFLTERQGDTFSQFSGSGVIIAGMNDIMNNFQSLISVLEEVAVAALPEPGKDLTVLYFS